MGIWKEEYRQSQFTLNGINDNFEYMPSTEQSSRTASSANCMEQIPPVDKPPKLNLVERNANKEEQMRFATESCPTVFNSYSKDQMGTVFGWSPGGELSKPNRVCCFSTCFDCSVNKSQLLVAISGTLF